MQRTQKAKEVFGGATTYSIMSQARAKGESKVTLRREGQGCTGRPDGGLTTPHQDGLGGHPHHLQTHGVSIQPWPGGGGSVERGELAVGDPLALALQQGAEAVRRGLVVDVVVVPHAVPGTCLAEGRDGRGVAGAAALGKSTEAKRQSLSGYPEVRVPDGQEVQRKETGPCKQVREVGGRLQ